MTWYIVRQWKLSKAHDYTYKIYVKFLICQRSHFCSQNILYPEALFSLYQCPLVWLFMHLFLSLAILQSTNSMHSIYDWIETKSLCVLWATCTLVMIEPKRCHCDSHPRAHRVLHLQYRLIVTSMWITAHVPCGLPSACIAVDHTCLTFQ